MSPAHPEKWPVLVIKGAVDDELLRDVRALLAAAEESDGNPPISEQTLVTMRAADTGPHKLLTLALYAPDEQSDPATAQDLAGFAVVVTAPPELREQRARRPDLALREQRLIPDEEKVRRADFVYVNDGTLDELDAFVVSVLERLAEAPRAG